MKKLLPILFALACVIISSCNNDEPEFDDSTGQLVVHLLQDGKDDVDFSDYSVAIIPTQGFIFSADVKSITWPIEAYVGTYTIAAASPMVEETPTSQSWYYGEVKDVKILEDQTTEVTVNLVLTEYPNSNY